MAASTFNKPRPIPIKDYKRKPLVYGRIKAGMLLSFNYQSHFVHDKNPLIYVLEVKDKRVWGINLRYKPWLFERILNDKDKEIKRLVRKKIKELVDKKEQLNLSLHEIDNNDVKEMLAKEVPIHYKEYFSFPSAKWHSDILRNYLKEYVINIQQIIFT